MLIWDTNWERLISITEIVSGTEERVPLYGDRTRTRAICRDGCKVSLLASPDKLAILSAPLIPAAPGFELLTAGADDAGEWYFSRQPIIAWRCAEFGPEPVLLDPPEETSDVFVAIKYPDGQVFDRPWLEVFFDEPAWRAVLPKRVAKLAKEKAEAAARAACENREAADARSN